MKRVLLSCSLALAGLLLHGNNASALKYTSIASGNFSSGTTWLGGLIPPLNLNSADTVLIDNGHNVTLDQNFSISQVTAMLDVRGILRSSGTEYINFNGSSALSVSGTVDIDSMNSVNLTNADIAGQLKIKKLRCLIFSSSGSGNVIISERLYVYGSITNTGGNTISIAPNAEIHMMGGEIVPSGTGIFTLPSTYDVFYTNSAHLKTTGIESGGVGLRHVTVDLLSDTSELKLGTDLNMGSGTLSLLKGILSLNNNDLRFGANGDLSANGNGKIKSSSASDIEINTSGSLSGAVTFSTGGNTTANLVINCGGIAKLGSALKVTGKVEFNNGKLDVQGNKLSLITGATVNGADANKYIITGTGGSLSADIGSGLSFTYQIGTSAEYLPCTITSNNNTVYNNMSVGVNPGVKVFGTSGNDMAASQPMVNATWFIEHINPNVDIDLELVWSNTSEANSFDRSNAYISHLVGNYWDKDDISSATQNSNGYYSLKRKSIKSLSPFAVFDSKTVDVDNMPHQHGDIKTFPNPVVNTLYIKSGQNSKLAIVNSSGRTVETIETQKGTTNLNTSNLIPGMYFLVSTDGTCQVLGRFAKQ